ncbi:hypothetical protein P5673_020334 [Acropora cervicornis]|uniref:Uncharacterized protein n=1 Tax=Acropora cervicornis TaxID=6130 RepID=A0AAD9QA67_ACRCE|nr:hypothetical protein P5673_020334 [Acropora cervicornis]
MLPIELDGKVPNVVIILDTCDCESSKRTAKSCPSIPTRSLVNTRSSSSSAVSFLDGPGFEPPKSSLLELEALDDPQVSSNSLILLLNPSSSDSSISSFMLSISHSAISSDELFTFKRGWFLPTDFRSAGSFLGVFSWTKQNFVGIDPGFKLTREEPGSHLKQSASKWSPHRVLINWRVRSSNLCKPFGKQFFVLQRRRQYTIKTFRTKSEKKTTLSEYFPKNVNKPREAITSKPRFDVIEDKCYCLVKKVAILTTPRANVVFEVEPVTNDLHSIYSRHYWSLVTAKFCGNFFEW